MRKFKRGDTVQIQDTFDGVYRKGFIRLTGNFNSWICHEESVVMGKNDTRMTCRMVLVEKIQNNKS
jgi:hypothetical protein